MIGAVGNRHNSYGETRKHGWPVKADRNHSSIPGVPVCDELRMVMGPARVADPERDVPGRDEDGRVRICGELKHVVHLFDSSGVPVNAVQHEGRGVLLLCGLDRDHGGLHRRPAARDQGHLH